MKYKLYNITHTLYFPEKETKPTSIVTSASYQMITLLCITTTIAIVSTLFHLWSCVSNNNGYRILLSDKA